MLLRQRLYRLFLPIALLLTFSVLAVPPPASAQGGYDDVSFWNDTPTPSFPRIDEPSVANAEGVFYLNPTGGRKPDDGIFPIINKGRIQVVRDRDFQVYASGNPSLQWMMTAEFGGTTYCFTVQSLSSPPHQCNVTAPGAGVVVQYWNQTTYPAGPYVVTEYTKTVTVDSSPIDIAMTVTYSYDSADPNVLTMFTALTLNPPSERTVKLYLAGDMLLDGDDDGAGVYTQLEGRNIVAQVGATAVGGIRVTTTEFDSYLADKYVCVFGNPSCVSTVSGKRGPGAAEPYPDYVNPDATTDIGIGAQWNYTTGGAQAATIVSELVFLSRAEWDALISGDASAEPATCAVAPTLTIKPDSDTVPVGASTTIWVELANHCRDLPTAPVDVLLSLDDGLRVLQTSAGALNLGQRAAYQRLSLPAGATFGWYAIVTNDAATSGSALAVAEIYSGGAVVRTDSRSLAVPAAPAPAAPAPAPAPLPAAPAAAPLPAALPNTAGAVPGLLPWLALFGLALIAVSSLQIRRRR